MSHTLEADGIQLAFDLKKVLSDIYLKCETGNITGLLGRNGSGKSCLLNIIYGTRKMEDKSVRLDGVFVKTPFAHPEILRYLPQDRFIPERLSLKRIFSDFELDFFEFQKLFPELRVGLNANLAKLSTGQQRLVEVYVILRTKAAFVLLDEPFSSLAPVQVDKLKEIITEEKTRKGMVITDHLYGHILELSDTLYVLKDGKLHLTKTVEDVERLGYVRF